MENLLKKGTEAAMHVLILGKLSIDISKQPHRFKVKCGNCRRRDYQAGSLSLMRHRHHLNLYHRSTISSYTY
uniref:Uncharacterized protein n=1 Tax=Glossina morsitans morsitans TaxID=37546 RepID=A0A1B0G0B5_GLOMM